MAEDKGLPALTVIVMGTVTGAAGGVLRDVLSGEVPLLFRQTELYATAAIAGVGVYLGLESVGVAPEPASYLGMVVVAALRFAAIRWSLRLPVFRVPDEEPTPLPTGSLNHSGMFQEPPIEMEWCRPWERLKDSCEALVSELQREFSPLHVLHGVPVVPVARRIDCDDILFATADPSKPLAVVHLTWAGKAERDPRWPSTTIYPSWQDWIERCLVPDHKEYGPADDEDS